MLPALMNIISRGLTGMGPLGIILMAVLPFVGFYIMRQRAAGLARTVDQLEASLKATQAAAAAAAKRRAASKKADDAAAAAKAKADEEAKAAAEAAAAKEAEVAEVKRTRGTGAAGSARAKQLRAAKNAGVVLLMLAYLCHSSQVRAEACTEGFDIRAKEVAKCDASCMPEDELELLIEDSLQCDRLRIEHDTVLKKHVADITSFSNKLSLCDQHVAKLEADIAKLTRVPVQPKTPTSTYILAGVGLLLTGAALGAVAMRQLDR